MSQWDEVDNRQASTYASEVSQRILELECENELLSRKIQSVVVNRRTGKRPAKTLYEINTDRQQACIARYWIRTLWSNSLMFEYRQVQSSRIQQD